MVIPLTQVTQDGWLTLVSGRQLVDHGLFAPDSLTILTHGQHWIDQQWLAQLTFYGLASAGGFKLAMLVHFGLVIGSVGFALAVARKRGAGPLSTAWVGALSILVAAWGWQMRSQNLAYPLFVGVLALLMFDRGKLSRRVFWVLPMLVLWANLHGSVLIGTLLVCVYAATSALQALRSERRFAIWVRCAALGTGA